MTGWDKTEKIRQMMEKMEKKKVLKGTTSLWSWHADRKSAWEKQEGMVVLIVRRTGYEQDLEGRTQRLRQGPISKMLAKLCCFIWLELT